MDWSPGDTTNLCSSGWHLWVDVCTELLFLPGKESPIRQLFIAIENFVVSLTLTSRNQGVTLAELSFAANISVPIHSLRLILHNITRTRPFLTQEGAQVMVQALVIACQVYCSLPLACVPELVIWPLQLTQNAAAWLIFNLPKFFHTNLLQFPVDVQIQFKTQVLACRAVNDSGPFYILDMACPICFVTANQLATPSVWRGPAKTLQSQDCCADLTLVKQTPPWHQYSRKCYMFCHRLKTHLFKLHLSP